LTVPLLLLDNDQLAVTNLERGRHFRGSGMGSSEYAKGAAAGDLPDPAPQHRRDTAADAVRRIPGCCACP
jgi:hypothetical protein